MSTSPQSTWGGRPIVSEITLSLMEDSGWYVPHYDQAGKLVWGRKAGCALVTGAYPLGMEHPTMGRLAVADAHFYCVSQPERTIARQPGDRPMLWKRGLQCLRIELPYRWSALEARHFLVRQSGANKRAFSILDAYRRWKLHFFILFNLLQHRGYKHPRLRP